MLHRISGRSTAAREVEAELPASLVAAMPAFEALSRRAQHARMLGHAATRRRRAAGTDERDYWRACAPAAVARAARLRGEVGFARLP